MYRKYTKRVLDFIIALLGFIVVFPILCVVAIFLAIVNNGKVFFFQVRPGKNEKLFKIIKFKTMNDKLDEHGNLLSDEKRLTKTGSFVRKTSLDELPQLLNVIKGDMSLIGPRPLLPEYLPFYNKEQAKRHFVKPGITGWAQVNGRNAISWEEKFKYDVWYVDNLSFKFDIQIILKTVSKIFSFNEISAEGYISMPRFDKPNELNKNKK